MCGQHHTLPSGWCSKSWKWSLVLAGSVNHAGLVGHGSADKGKHWEFEDEGEILAPPAVLSADVRRALPTPATFHRSRSPSHRERAEQSRVWLQAATAGAAAAGGAGEKRDAPASPGGAPPSATKVQKTMGTLFSKSADSGGGDGEDDDGGAMSDSSALEIVAAWPSASPLLHRSIFDIYARHQHWDPRQPAAEVLGGPLEPEVLDGRHGRFPREPTRCVDARTRRGGCGPASRRSVRRC